jgi:hypothetical protein
MLLKRRTVANGKCRATTKAGRQCAAPAIRGGIYCVLHSDPKKAAELGQKGGRANRRTFETPSQEVVPPESIGEVKRMLAQTMANVLAGKIDPKLGTTVAYMGIALLRAYEADPPAPPEMPSIYTALQYRIARSPVTAEDIQQKELQAPGPASAPALHGQTGKVEVVQDQEEGDLLILDYDPGASRNPGR